MTTNAITPAEWKEIEGYLLERPQCKIDETGVIWFQVDDVIRGGMHPRLFLDICREELFQSAFDIDRSEKMDMAMQGKQLSTADIRAFRDAGIPLTSEAGFEALKKQLRGC